MRPSSGRCAVRIGTRSWPHTRWLPAQKMRRANYRITFASSKNGMAYHPEIKGQLFSSSSIKFWRWFTIIRKFILIAASLASEKSSTAAVQGVLGWLVFGFWIHLILQEPPLKKLAEGSLWVNLYHSNAMKARCLEIVCLKGLGFFWSLSEHTWATWVWVNHILQLGWTPLLKKNGALGYTPLFADRSSYMIVHLRQTSLKSI